MNTSPRKGQPTRPYGIRLNRDRRPVSGASAFTLIEVLAALVIAGVLFTALLSALRGVLGLRERADAEATSDIVVQQCLRALDADVTCAVPPGGGLATVFLGEMTEEKDIRRDRLEFCTATNSPRVGVFGGDIVKVVYEVVDSEDDNGWELVRAVYRNLLSTSTEEPEESVLLRSVRSLELSYFDGASWVASWDASLQDNAIPEAVRVRIETGEGDAADQIIEWSSAVVAQSVQQSGGGARP
jgi:type II secretion system protein J